MAALDLFPPYNPPSLQRPMLKMAPYPNVEAKLDPESTFVINSLSRCKHNSPSGHFIRLHWQTQANIIWQPTNLKTVEKDLLRRAKCQQFRPDPHCHTASRKTLIWSRVYCGSRKDLRERERVREKWAQEEQRGILGCFTSWMKTLERILCWSLNFIDLVV